MKRTVRTILNLVAVGLVPALAMMVPATSAAPAAAATTAQMGCGVPEEAGALDLPEAEMVVLVNGYREQIGAPPLTVSAALTRAARVKALTLAAAGEAGMGSISHDDPERTWQQRINDCGYTAGGMAEDISASADAPPAVLALWQSSAFHDQNLRDSAWAVVGIARAPIGMGSPFWYWVVIFGSEVEAV